MSNYTFDKDGCIQDITEYASGFSVIASILKWEAAQENGLVNTLTLLNLKHGIPYLN